jgi:hypothetical protein
MSVTRKEVDMIAEAYCLARFSYDGPYAKPDGRDEHLQSDIIATADQILGGHYDWLVAVFEAGRRSAAEGGA